MDVHDWSQTTVRLSAIIACEETIPVTYLAREAGMNHSDVTRITGKLAAWGLVCERRLEDLRLLEPSFTRLELVFTKRKGLETRRS